MSLSLVLAALSVLAACSTSDRDKGSVTPGASIAPVTTTAPPPSAESSASPTSGPVQGRTMESLTIQENTQATIDDVRIGVANVWEDDYPDENGAKKKGMTALLAIFVRDDSARNQKVRVHPGQKVDVSKIHIEVKAVGSDFVELRITPM